MGTRPLVLTNSYGAAQSCQSTAFRSALFFPARCRRHPPTLLLVRSPSLASPAPSSNSSLPKETMPGGTSTPRASTSAKTALNDLDDRRIRNIRPLIPPQILMEDYPLGLRAAATVLEGRKSGEDIVRGDDDRLIVVSRVLAHLRITPRAC